jgi:hypothetical protein
LIRKGFIIIADFMAHATRQERRQSVRGGARAADLAYRASAKTAAAPAGVVRRPD